MRARRAGRHLILEYGRFLPPARVSPNIRPAARRMHFQLFGTLPPPELVDRVAQAFGVADVRDRSRFTCADVVERGTCDRIEGMHGELVLYYLPCKARVYLTPPLTVQRALTILRHVLRVTGAKLESSNRHIGRRKVIVYTVRAKGSSLMQVLRAPVSGDDEDVMRVTFE